MASKIRIAVIGGGIGGCTLANGLKKHPHVEFDVFEGSPAFKEQGLAVGLSQNALSSLRLLQPNLIDGLKTAGAVPAHSSHVIVGEGPDAGKHVCDIVLKNGGINVNRSLFLKELLRDVPETSLHVNKKLQRIETGEDDLLTLHFEDGTTGQYHAVVGSDGIRSTVRRNVLANHSEYIEPKFAGFWDVRAAVPIETAKDAGILNGNETESSWIGDGGYIIHQLVNDGQLLGLIVAGVAKDGSYDGSKWRNPVDREFLAKALGDRGEVGNKTLELMLTHTGPDKEPFAFSQYESPLAPTYFNGAVCIMGDAAHAMTPWQGSGAGTSIEDAAVLEALLGKVTKPSEIPAAFKAYDEARRPRTHRIIKSSREIGNICCGQDPTLKLDVEKLRASLPPRWDFIHRIDMEKHVTDTLAAFEQFKAEAK